MPASRANRSVVRDPESASASGQLVLEGRAPDASETPTLIVRAARNVIELVRRTGLRKAWPRRHRTPCVLQRMRPYKTDSGIAVACTSHSRTHSLLGQPPNGPALSGARQAEDPRRGAGRRGGGMGGRRARPVPRVRSDRSEVLASLLWVHMAVRPLQRVVRRHFARLRSSSSSKCCCRRFVR